MRTFLPVISLLLWAAGALPAADTTFWVEPCSSAQAGCRPGDQELARWALLAWEKVSEKHLHFVEIKDRDNATIRVRWADKDSGLYGEAVPIEVHGRPGAELHILVPEKGSIDDDLLRDTIVYLTCLHESGHALGLSHTREFADIMYSFQFGGDITEYFGRYRRVLKAREDIRQNSGMSEADRLRLLRLLERGGGLYQ